MSGRVNAPRPAIPRLLNIKGCRSRLTKQSLDTGSGSAGANVSADKMQSSSSPLPSPVANRYLSEEVGRYSCVLKISAPSSKSKSRSRRLDLYIAESGDLKPGRKHRRVNKNHRVEQMEDTHPKGCHAVSSNEASAGSKDSINFGKQPVLYQVGGEMVEHGEADDAAE